MAKQPPVHQDPSKLTEVSEADHKEIKKHFNNSVFILEPTSADHIAANVYVRKRNFSFRAAVALLQSLRIDLFTNEDSASGYIACGSSEPSNHHEDQYVKKGRLAVVFKLKYNKNLIKKVVEILGGANLTRIDVHCKTVDLRAIRYAKWKESSEEIQEQLRVAEEVIRPLGFL